MRFRSKVDLLRDLRAHPEFWLGIPPGSAHLHRGLHAAKELLWWVNAFQDPRRQAYVVSPHQYHVLCETGPLIPDVASQIDWAASDDLLLALQEVRSEPLCRGAFGPWHDQRPTMRLLGQGISAVLQLAERGALSVRTPDGLWCQGYVGGWPQSAPEIIEEPSAIGLMVAAELTEERFPGLPFRRADLRLIAAHRAGQAICCEWHDADDIMPECRPDCHCLLHYESIREWL